tara:strand:+ start:1741 stop:1965 length:225 start_codon:yes stop_codon:yes gene_type:complete
MKRGDLVESIKHTSIGVVVEIFDDLDPENAWVRVLFTTPKERYQWVKFNGLKVLNKKKGGRGLLSRVVARSGSL